MPRLEQVLSMGRMVGTLGKAVKIQTGAAIERIQLLRTDEPPGYRESECEPSHLDGLPYHCHSVPTENRN